MENKYNIAPNSLDSLTESSVLNEDGTTTTTWVDPSTGNTVLTCVTSSNGKTKNYTSVQEGTTTTFTATVNTDGSLALTSISTPEENTKMIIPDWLNVKSVAGSSYKSMIVQSSTIEEVTLPGGLQTIGYYTFYKCTNLKDINIPESVTSIGDSAFSGCSSLTTIEIPSSVTSIGSSAFYNCRKLISINIPEGVTTINNKVFEQCVSLTSINIPEGVTSIGEYAFNVSGLTSINIPEGVTSIGFYAFWTCSKLSTVIIDSETVASGLTSQASMNGLIRNATTIKIKSGLTVGSYVEDTVNFPNVTTEVIDGVSYNVYSK